WYEAFRDAAAALDAWHRDGGPRPAGHLRAHPTEHAPHVARVGFDLVHRLMLDPDGRPRRLRRSGTY
ncbi:MAG: phospholipase, partial [Acidimicrobiia bacterium]